MSLDGIETQRHGRDDANEQSPQGIFSDEFDQILRSMDGNMDPSDSASFDLEPLFPHSKDLSTHTPGDSNNLYDNWALMHEDDAGDSRMERVQLQESEPISRLAGVSEDPRNVLKQWLDQHSHHPYPTKHEKESLAQQTKLSVTQVSTWFANARRRRKRRPEASNEPLTFSTFNCVNNELQPATHEDWSSLSPLDRWRNSPPEVEPAPLETIIGAVARSEKDDLSGPTSFTSDDANHQGSSRPNADDAGSMVSSNASGSALSSSSGSSAYSFDSNHSHGSFGCFYLNEPSRRRRRRRSKVSSFIPPKTAKRSRGGKRPYQCTFCTDTFRTKHDWTRHEKTLHLSLERFTCAPFGATYSDESDGTSKCAFCDDLNPSENHVESHRFSSCQQKPAAFRTFYRKDHLVQHLRLVHGVGQSTPSMETWKSQVTNINSRCGFCSEKFVLWSERNDHLAQHFRKGSLMKDWRGCRGLDPPVALAVENAMPPYLIGTESMGMDPFSASRLADKGENARADCRAAASGQLAAGQSKPTPYEYLTARLTEFVHEMQAITGETVTDEMLQRRARTVVYDDDDPWNQTAADNPEWLKLFKEGMGLGSTANPSLPHSSIQPAQGQSGDNDYAFCLPWTTDQCAVAPDSSNTVNADMTWSWQSPECLVEYRQYMAMCSAGAPTGQRQDVEFPITCPASGPDVELT